MADGCSGWSFFNPMCHVSEGVQAVVGDAIENMANAVMEAFGKAVASLGTDGGTVYVAAGTYTQMTQILLTNAVAGLC